MGPSQLYIRLLLTDSINVLLKIGVDNQKQTKVKSLETIQNLIWLPNSYFEYDIAQNRQTSPNRHMLMKLGFDFKIKITAGARKRNYPLLQLGGHFESDIVQTDRLLPSDTNNVIIELRVAIKGQTIAEVRKTKYPILPPGGHCQFKFTQNQ